MTLRNRWFLLAGATLLCLLAPAWSADDKDEMVENPQYKFWSGFKPGATAVHVEKVTLSGPDRKHAPDGVDVKEITYKLLESTPEKVVVQVVVLDHEFLGLIEAAPTKSIYPAKVKKSHLKAVLD